MPGQDPRDGLLTSATIESAWLTRRLPIAPYTISMFDDAMLHPQAARSQGVLASMRAAMARLPLWADNSRPHRGPLRAHVEQPDRAAGGAWISPPREQPLPRDLNLPLSAFDPGALRRTVGPAVVASAAAFVDPIILERMLHRIPAR